LTRIIKRRARGDGVKLKPLIVYKGVPGARIEAEVTGFDDDLMMQKLFIVSRKMLGHIQRCLTTGAVQY